MHFECVVKRISPTLKRIAHRLNGHFSYFNDEDLYQEALLHLWKNFREGKLNNKTDSYILQGCYFHLKNYIRKAKLPIKLISIETIVNDGEATNLGETVWLQDNNSKRYLDALNNKMLLETICNNGFTKREREVLSLCLEGLTTRELGKKLDISHVRVVKLKSKIKAKCQKFMDR